MKWRYLTRGTRNGKTFTRFRYDILDAVGETQLSQDSITMPRNVVEFTSSVVLSHVSTLTGLAMKQDLSLVATSLG